MTSDMTTLSSSRSDIRGPEWRQIQENQAWDDFLAWCREQENSPHE
jgi:hypothetical protein